MHIHQKITQIPGQNIFIFSDPHYNHKNICLGETEWGAGEKNLNKFRHFQTLSEMNAVIINNINSIVGQDDILYCLGDFAFGGHDNIRIFRERIVCKNIHLIFGNHDEHIIKNTNNYRDLFLSVNQSINLQVVIPSKEKDIRAKKLTFILSHFPYASWDSMSKGVMHLFGHLHLPKELKLIGNRSMDVGLDGNDLKPYNILEVNKLLKNDPIRSLFSFDHHIQE